MARLAIGMPVYNGALYIEDVVRSLLAQSERDIVIDTYERFDGRNRNDPRASRA